MSRMKSEFETHIEDLEQEHNSAIKQVLKECNLKMAEKDKEFQETFGEAVGKWLKLIWRWGPQCESLTHVQQSIWIFLVAVGRWMLAGFVFGL